jgi:hypothetical protein
VVRAGTINRHLGRHRNCRFRGATTVLPREYYELAGNTPRAIHDARARLFFYNNAESDWGNLYGCAYGAGRAVRLGSVESSGSQGGRGIAAFSLGGVFAITESGQSGHPSPTSEAVVQLSSAVTVFDLRDGHRLLHWRTQPPSNYVKSAVVTQQGAAAWITYSYMGEWTLLASTAGGAVRSLQSGSATSEPRSLSLAGDRLSWTSAGLGHSVTLR